MYLNFRWLMARLPAQSKVIVWAATTHVAKELSGVGGAEVGLGTSREGGEGGIDAERGDGRVALERDAEPVPGQGLPTWLLGIEGPASRLAQALRLGAPPVLTRIEGNLCSVDVRTVLRAEDDQLQDAIEAAVLGVRGPSKAD